MTAPYHHITAEDERDGRPPVTMFGPDLPFPYDDWLRHPAGHELMKLGLKPVVYDSRRLGGRLHSEEFKGAEGIVAELGEAWHEALDQGASFRSCRAG
jgi:tryptophan 2-monooxygenase